MKISLVVPVFNEEDTIPIFYKTAREFEELKPYDVEIVFVNDGSKDVMESTTDVLVVLDPLVVPLSFTRSPGKEPALFVGLGRTASDAVISIDVDLQDPIGVILQLIEKWQAGVDMVLIKRSDRSTDGRLKRKAAEWFYRLHNKISSPQIEENVRDFRLMSREVMENIKLPPECNLFMKDTLSWVGGGTDVVEYARVECVADNTKLNGRELWNSALKGITSFSTFPLCIWTYIGLLVAGVSFLYGAWMTIDTLAFGDTVRGHPSLLVSILFLGGTQLVGIGVLGEYIGRIYVEAKHRPRYIKRINKSNGEINE